MAEPDKILIPYHDFDDRFGLVGRYGADNQYIAFVTGAYPANWNIEHFSRDYLHTRWAEHKRWYAVLHRFDANGNHLGTEARCGGTTASGQGKAIKEADRALAEMLEPLGPREPGNIRVKPFGMHIDGYFFGLVYKCVNPGDPDNPDATHEYVMLEPNDIMFHPPWDSGEYST
jgi:hypothetical protein